MTADLTAIKAMLVDAIAVSSNHDVFLDEHTELKRRYPRNRYSDTITLADYAGPSVDIDADKLAATVLDYYAAQQAEAVKEQLHRDYEMFKAREAEARHQGMKDAVEPVKAEFDRITARMIMFKNENDALKSELAAKASKTVLPRWYECRSFLDRVCRKIEALQSTAEVMAWLDTYGSELEQWFEGNLPEEATREIENRARKREIVAVKGAPIPWYLVEKAAPEAAPATRGGEES
jgi:hypothetical protein